MDAIVTWKLKFGDAQLVLESLKERQRSLEDHGKLKGENAEMRQRVRDSRAKAIKLSDIIKAMEG